MDKRFTDVMGHLRDLTEMGPITAIKLKIIDQSQLATKLYNNGRMQMAAFAVDLERISRLGFKPDVSPYVAKHALDNCKQCSDKWTYDFLKEGEQVSIKAKQMLEQLGETFPIEIADALVKVAEAEHALKDYVFTKTLVDALIKDIGRKYKLD